MAIYILMPRTHTNVPYVKTGLGVCWPSAESSPGFLACVFLANKVLSETMALVFRPGLCSSGVHVAGTRSS